MIDKNLKIRCGAALINRAFPDLIPEFAVALARGYTDVPANYVDFQTDTWYALRKYDGVRVLAFIRKGVVEFRSREGNVFVTLIRLENLINNDWAKRSPEILDNIVLDGELCIMMDGKENFKEAVKQVKRKSGYVSDPRYFVFDMFTIEEFESKFSKRTYKERMNELNQFLNQFSSRGLILSADCVKINNDVHLAHLEQSAANREWEGLILRKDTVYEGKRSNNMLKIKRFQDAEYICTGITRGNMRFIIDGKDTEIETISSITIDVDGNSVDVGSGFNLEERQLYAHHPEKIVGKIVCISYFEKSHDKNGKTSLRFPTFKCVYDDERTF